MKILFQIFLLMSCSFAIASTGGEKNAGNGSNALSDNEIAEKSLKVSGYVTLNRDRKYESSVRLYCNNDEVDLRPTVHGGQFEFNLLPDYYYTIEVMKKGYVTKRIVVNTNAPGYFTSPKRIEFDIDLLKAEKVESPDNSVMDFPIAVISYNIEKESFVYNNQYSIGYLMEIEKMKEIPFLLRWIGEVKK